MTSLNSRDEKQRKPLPKALMLKDYLLDDLSSCSSNGFRSYPRRQCCTTVRFLLEIDLKSRVDRDSSDHAKRLLRSKSKSASSTMSKLLRASEAVINSVKNLPFAAVKPPSSSKPNNPKKAILPRSLSRKLLKRSFWKKTDKEIQRWRSLRELLQEKEKPVDFSPSITTVTTKAAAAAATTSSTSVSESNTNNNSWSDSDFTTDYLLCSSGNSVNSGVNDGVESRNLSPEKVVSKRVGVTNTTNSVENTKKEWSNEEEKEQFSPVSVLDFPFDEEEEASSPFQSRLARMEGTKQKLMQKIRRFESLAQLEPVDLEKRIALSESNDESLESPMQPCSVSVQYNITADKEEEESKTEKALEFLNLLKMTIPSNSFKFNADNLLLDFFRESLTATHARSNVGKGGEQFEYEQVNVANDWINGQPRELLLEWEVQKNRQACIRDMEEEGRWRMLDEDKEEVALGLEDQVFASLIDELLIDLFSS
ncbi:uncharacterized protein LOC132307851 [Cornus florida]|uniref:uncharacterized protein LOC132307851 n=1 Tax=Cornus florida TaxID=4283 RepID=UPI0028A24E4B|nr:uncharacterized protein LOC132307851 [Cornus florida]